MSEENINSSWLWQFYQNELTSDRVVHFSKWIAEYEQNNLNIFNDYVTFEDLPADMQVGVMWRYLEENGKAKRPMAYQIEVVKKLFAGFMQGID